MTLERRALVLRETHFEKIRSLLRSAAGIHLRDGKQALVRSRVQKRLRALSLPSFDAYMKHLEKDRGGVEVRALIDALTTNKTSFYREPTHYTYLRDTVLPELVRDEAELRFWSAGCSSGQEPLTMAMIIRDTLGRSVAAGARILATDISDTMLESARAGVYAAAAVKDLPSELQRYVRHSRSDRVEIDPEIRSMVTFARLNLVDGWPMRGPFDVIFCRNVMIYFQRDTQIELVKRFHALLRPGGYLFVGHSESLTGWEHGFQYMLPAVYRR